MSSAWVAVKINYPEYEPHHAASEPREADRNVPHEPLGYPGAPSITPRFPHTHTCSSPLPWLGETLLKDTVGSS